MLSTALAMLAACLVLLCLLGHKPLAEWDEAIYAEVSREMLTGSWLVPHWNRQLWLEKPPLMLWITAAFFKLFSVNEFWARAGSAFSGIALVGLLHAWLAKRRDTLTAWFCTVVLLSTFGFLRAARVGETDVLLSLGCILTLFGLTQVDEFDLRGWLLFWIGFAIAVMTKGAAAVVLPITAVVFAAIQRWNTARLGRNFWIGFALFLLLILPWHIAMLHLYGKHFLNEYFGLHVLARATHQIEEHPTPFWYYFKVLLVSAPPFVLFYPSALAHALRRAQLRVWAIFPLVILSLFTVVQTRLPHYIAPVYPALAVLTAVYLADRLRPYLAERRSATFWLRLALVASAIAIATVWITAPARRLLHNPRLADGTLHTDDNKNAIALIRSAFARPQPIDGPLLLWQDRTVSISSDVFYSHRVIQQVQLDPGTEAIATNRYTHNPESLDQAVAAQPRLILLDRDLVAQLPARFAFTPIQIYGSVELGRIVRAP
jgi:4-amino-4-deoxy-L-arabinose transferase-like glycosyltransferase